jgi:hypothetical protein
LHSQAWPAWSSPLYTPHVSLFLASREVFCPKFNFTGVIDKHRLYQVQERTMLFLEKIVIQRSATHCAAVCTSVYSELDNVPNNKARQKVNSESKAGALQLNSTVLFGVCPQHPTTCITDPLKSAFDLAHLSYPRHQSSHCRFWTADQLCMMIPMAFGDQIDGMPLMTAILAVNEYFPHGATQTFAWRPSLLLMPPRPWLP